MFNLKAIFAMEFISEQLNDLFSISGTEAPDISFSDSIV